MSTQEDSLIVRLILDKDTEEEHGISLRGLVNRVDAIEATVWFAKPKMRSIQGFNDDNTLLKYRLGRKECLEEQYSVDSTLAAMQSSDNESRGPVHISTGIPKVDFSSLKPIIRYTIIANMYTAALQEGFQDPFFPIQRLIDVSAKQILHALSMIEKTYFDGFYPDSITSQAMQAYGARATLERQHTPDFVNSPPILPTGNYSAFGVPTRENNAPNCSPSRPRFRFRRHSSPQQMAQPARITPPSKQPDPPSVVYGQQSSLEESEFAVLTMMGATSSRVVGSNDASPPKKKKKDTPKAAATPDQQQPQPLATRSPNLLPAPPLPPAPKPSPATTTTQHDAHHHLFETAYHRQIQEQQAAQALSSLHRSASTAATRPAGFHAPPSSSSSSSTSSSPDAVPPAPPSTPASGAPHPSVSGRGVTVAPPRVVPTAPMTTERTVRAHFAFPDRSNIRLPPSFGAEVRAASVAVESAGPSAGGGGRMDPFEVFMAGVVEQARDGGGDGGSGGRGGDGGAVE
ncbi:hypothetical protein GTA08_BOTSDO10289 [Neofusicoccum parvum]|nr:hypothetical protein GTA08_BOTSDO10289 [Neofusicoccum parvum]